MSDFFAAGRRAVLAGDVRLERLPSSAGERWGVSAILRPAGRVVDRLAGLSESLGEIAGPGHWVHGAPAMHFTLRALEPYRLDVPPEDPLRLLYAAALREAVAGLPTVGIELRGVSLMHFASPLTDPAAIVAWCESHEDTPIGVAEMDTVEITYATHDGVAMRLDPLERVPLG